MHVKNESGERERRERETDNYDMSRYLSFIIIFSLSNFKTNKLTIIVTSGLIQNR